MCTHVLSITAGNFLYRSSTATITNGFQHQWTGRLEPNSSLHLHSSTGEEVLGISQAEMVSNGLQTVAAMTVDSRLEANTVSYVRI